LRGVLRLAVTRRVCYAFPMTLGRTSLYASVLAALVFTAGCLSGKRETVLNEVTTLFDGPDPNAEYVWPIYMHHHGLSSAVWPIFKWGDNQFAIRPIYGYEHGINDIVWPIGAFDVNRDEYRLFPLLWVYPRRNVYVLFPLAYSFGDTYGIPPLFNIRENDGRYGFCNVTLGWYSSVNEGESHNWGLFPLYWHFGGAEGENHQDCFFPLWNVERDLVWTPLFYHNWTRKITSVTPLYWHKANRYDCLFPLWYVDSDSVLTPLYYHNSTDGVIGVTPFYWHKTDGYDCLFPLWYSDRDRFLSLLYCRTRDSDDKRHDTLHVVPPLLSGIDTDDTGTRFFSPLVTAGRNRDEWRFDTLCELLSHYSTSKGKTADYILGCGRTHEELNATVGDSIYALYGSLYYRNKTTHFSTNAVPLSSNYTTRVGGGLFYYADGDTDGSSYSSSSLLTLAWNVKHSADGTDKLRAFMYLYWRTRAADGSGERFVFPFLSSYEGADGSSKDAFLWRLYRQETDAKGESRHWLLFLPMPF
jgi:hypothetical protein